MNVSEKYTRAAHSTNLGMDTLSVRDSDVLAAAGWAGQGERAGLGTLLMRLRAEADAVTLQEAAGAGGDLTSRVLVLMRLQSLEAVKRALMTHACRLVVRLGADLTVERQAEVAGMALQSWLWPQCDACGGRGQSGQYGKLQHICTACHGTGKRKMSKAGADEDMLLAAMLDDMDRKSASSAGCMAGMLKQDS